MTPPLVADLVEAYAEITECEADAAWLAWVRAAVAPGVRCDAGLAGLPLVIDRGKQRTTTIVPTRRRDR